MRIVVDSHFEIGSTHQRCEDSAISASGLLLQEENVFYAHAAISDGCSSAIDSHIGSEFLCKLSLAQGPIRHHKMRVGALDCASPHTAKENMLLDLVEGIELAKRSYNKISETLDFMPNNKLADPTSFYATLLDVSITGDMRSIEEGIIDETLLVRAIGDGIIAVRERESGHWRWFRIAYPSGAPLYAVYLAHSNSMDNYEKKFGIPKAVVTTGLLGEEEFEIHSENEGWEILYFDFKISEYDMVILFSDGAESFRAEEKSFTYVTKTNVSFQEVLAHMTTIKNTNGGFLRRRANKFLGKFCTDNGWSHYDDFSVAAMYIGN